MEWLENYVKKNVQKYDGLNLLIDVARCYFRIDYDRNYLYTQDREILKMEIIVQAKSIIEYFSKFKGYDGKQEQQWYVDWVTLMKESSRYVSEIIKGNKDKLKNSLEMQILHYESLKMANKREHNKLQLETIMQGS
jgi:hypothetical protein